MEFNETVQARRSIKSYEIDVWRARKVNLFSLTPKALFIGDFFASRREISAG